MINPSAWDQRIPNEPIYERQFLIERPPIIPQSRPLNSSQSQCTRAPPPYLLMDCIAEADAMNYWYCNVVNNTETGVNSGCKKGKSLQQMTQEYPNRPWLHGVHRNIRHDSQLSNRNYYNPNDCISESDRLDVINRIADQELTRQMTIGQLFRNGALCDGRIWNQSTSVRGTEPINSMNTICPK